MHVSCHMLQHLNKAEPPTEFVCVLALNDSSFSTLMQHRLSGSHLTGTAGGPGSHQSPTFSNVPV